MMTIDQYSESVIAQGGKVTNSFTGANREPVITLDEGDTFTIPEKLEVFSQPITGSDATYQYLRLEVTGKGGAKQYKNIGPSVFNRTLPVYTEAGITTGNWKESAGTAHDLFMSKGTINDAFKALANKKIKISKVERVLTRSFREGQKTRNAAIYTTDIVE